MNRRFYLFIVLILSCLIALGAKSKAKKADPVEILKKGKEAFSNYEFEEAEDLFDEYKTLIAKSKQKPDEEFETLESQLTIALNAFDRVQKIVVIDSISMPRDQFFSVINLMPSAGKIGNTDTFVLKNGPQSKELSFLNEDRDYLITSMPDADGFLNLIEYRQLLDGSWESLDALKGDFDLDGDYINPFLNGDGQTLYFANDGEGSMGGYDIFVAQKEPLTGESLQPLNIGMPFNSPYDDLMLAIDEERGIGWWVTDRNDPEGNVTIYVYLLDEVRKNYPSSTENLVDYARMRSYKATWESGEEPKYQQILNSLKK